jgi:serpin B
VLTNAIYFKGDWRDPFPASYTRTLPFHLSASQSIQVPLMYRSGNYNYFDGGTFQELELPYAGKELSMIVFLPKEIAGLPALERSFTAENVQSWLSKLKYPDKVKVKFPKFKMAAQFDLGTAMAAMGMKLAFQPGTADFAGMSGGRDLWISAAVHNGIHQCR